MTEHAHEIGSHVHASTAGSPWDIAVLAVLAVCGWLYWRGSQRLKARHAHVRPAERIAFWAGWLTAIATLMPQVDRAAAELFSAHMAQHELLMLVVAPLMIAGRPILPWLWALPLRLRTGAGSTIGSPTVSAAWALLTMPLVAWTLHGLAIWVWHLPALYEAALRDDGLHALQHAMFVGTAVLFWWGLVYGRYGRAAYGAAVLYVFATLVHTGLLGAMFTLSDRSFYPLYVERAAAAGVDPVADQQLAGLYMWVPSGIVLTLFGLALFAAWLGEAERRAGAAAR
jgi:cytochrome c oxidase assembly factor CtaG